MNFRYGTQRKGLVVRWGTVHRCDLKLVRPNVRRYKLLMLNYLQMFGSFRQPTTKVQKKFKVQLLPSAHTCHKQMLGAGSFSNRSVLAAFHQNFHQGFIFSPFKSSQIFWSEFVKLFCILSTVVLGFIFSKYSSEFS